MNLFHLMSIRDLAMHATTTGPIQFNSDTDKRGSIICASIIALSLAVLSSVLRVIARHKVHAPLKADDYWIFFGTFMAVNVCASTFAMAKWGLGLHIDAIQSPEALAKSVLASQVLYAASIVPIKVSILYLYHRIFPSPGLRKLSIAIAAVIVTYSIVLIVCMLTQCVPLNAIWDQSVAATCFDINTVYIVMAVLNVLTDVLILLLPIKYVWALELARGRKLQILSVFLLGSCVCAFGIVRAVVVGTASTYDQSWNNVSAAIWSEVEICVGVVSANLPCLQPLVRKLPKALGGSSSGQGTGGPAQNKRISRGMQFEMGRRPKSGIGMGWEHIDEGSDTHPFAAATTVVGPSPNDSRGASRVDVLRRMGSDGVAKPFDTAIVVETTIETTVEKRYDDRTNSSGSSLD